MHASARDRAIAALTLYGEARSESRLGKAAVMWVILHRAANPRWWGHDGIASVCLAPAQFSAWNRSDPNRAKMLALLADQDTGRAALTDAAYRNAAFLDCLRVVDDVLAGRVPDPTRGATHYLTPAVWKETVWARNKTPCAEIGGHLFFNDIERGVRPYRFPEPKAEAKPSLLRRVVAWLREWFGR